MKCLSCGAETLLAYVEISREIPLAARNGAVKVGGVKIGQLDLKTAWEYETNEEGEAVERKLRGPIRCGTCSSEHFYVVGAKEPLMMGSYEEALELGVDAFLGG